MLILNNNHIFLILLFFEFYWILLLLVFVIADCETVFSYSCVRIIVVCHVEEVKKFCPVGLCSLNGGGGQLFL
jgi:hypothetical protein